MEENILTANVEQTSTTKPPIYATCPAGCQWETVHKADFELVKYNTVRTFYLGIFVTGNNINNKIDIIIPNLENFQADFNVAIAGGWSEKQSFGVTKKRFVFYMRANNVSNKDIINLETRTESTMGQADENWTISEPYFKENKVVITISKLNDKPEAVTIYLENNDLSSNIDFENITVSNIYEDTTTYPKSVEYYAKQEDIDTINGDIDTINQRLDALGFKEGVATFSGFLVDVTPTQNSIKKQGRYVIFDFGINTPNNSMPDFETRIVDWKQHARINIPSEFKPILPIEKRLFSLSWLDYEHWEKDRADVIELKFIEDENDCYIDIWTFQSAIYNLKIHLGWETN